MRQNNLVACATILASPEFDHWGRLTGWTIIQWHIGRQFEMPGYFAQNLSRWSPYQRYFFLEFPATEHYSAWDNAEEWLRQAEEHGFIAGDGREKLCWPGMQSGMQ